MKLFFSICFLFFVHISIAQLNKALSLVIDSLAEEDQKWRTLSTKIENNEVDTVDKKIISNKIRLTDSLNFFKLKEIFKIYGFPGYDLVGIKSSNNYWLLIQHADKHPDFQEEVLIDMEIKVKKKNASGINYAYLFDRVKVNRDQLQLYGTQMILNSDSTSYIPKPLRDSESVNERRMILGLPTIEQYAKIMNEHYRGSLKKQ